MNEDHLPRQGREYTKRHCQAKSRQIVLANAFKLHTFSMECDVSVRASGFTMMYTDGVRRKTVEGNGKEYTISELVRQLGCDSVTRIENS